MASSQYAEANRARILADAIPALTLPVGANPVHVLQAIGHNFNMQALYQNDWPADRMRTTETNNWHHSDYREAAYIFTYKLFEKMVNTGEMR
jgi:hypothetical protein